MLTYQGAHFHPRSHPCQLPEHTDYFSKTDKHQSPHVVIQQIFIQQILPTVGKKLPTVEMNQQQIPPIER